MILILVSLMFLVFGILNFYEDYNEQRDNIQSEENQGVDGRNGVDVIKQNDGENIAFDSEEMLVKRNSDLIQQLKAQYSDEDTEIIKSESSSVQFFIYEIAGYIFQDLKKIGECEKLGGVQISSVKVVIMNYNTDEMICTLTSEGGSPIRYSPGNENKFYCVFFHEDYNICVTHPFQVLYEEDYDTVTIFLEKKDCQYTPLCQLRLFMRNLGMDEEYAIVPSDYEVCFSCINTNSYEINCSYVGYTSKAGILFFGQNTYFSLNTDYILDIYLRQEFDSDVALSSSRIFEGNIKNSNQTDIYFEFDNE